MTEYPNTHPPMNSQDPTPEVVRRDLGFGISLGIGSWEFRPGVVR